MKIRALIPFLTLLLAACQVATPPPTATAIPTALPTAPALTPAFTPTFVSGGGYPPGALAARRMLAEELDVDITAVEIRGVEAANWPDSCLGAAHTGEGCAEVITPGFRIILLVGLAQYEYRSDLDGAAVRRAGGPTLGSAGEEARAALVWEGPDCELLLVTPTQAFTGRCDGAGTLAAPAVGPEHLQVVSTWLTGLQAFERRDGSGALTFAGFGPSVPTAAEERMLTEWARLTYDLAISGRSGAAWGLAMAWSRQGGIAGFCDDVAVYLDGRVVVNNCQADPLAAETRLTASQLEQLYAWLDEFSAVDYDRSDPAVADAMTIRLITAGTGSKPAGDEDIRAMTEFMADVAAQARAGLQIGNQMLAAGDVLAAFLEALHAGDFSRAAVLYGGETDGLAAWNPDLPDDLPALLERGCTRNGLQCLRPRSINYLGADSRGGHVFMVEFNNADGTLFRADASGGVAVFRFSVLMTDNGAFVVMELPPYLP